MKKKNKKVLKKTRFNFSKTNIELVALALLILIIPLSLWLNLFHYGFYYLKCQDKPVEVYGQYYRLPIDKGYGIHPGSDYTNCSWAAPLGKIRDPSTPVSVAAKARENQQPAADHDLYFPAEYSISKLLARQHGRAQWETTFEVTTSSNTTFRVSEMNKNSDFSLTNLCSKPASENWSGTIVGKDTEGRDVCRVNKSKYIKDYVVGIDIGETGIMLRTKEGNEDQLNKEAIDIFSSMEPFFR